MVQPVPMNLLLVTQKLGSLYREEAVPISGMQSLMYRRFMTTRGRRTQTAHPWKVSLVRNVISTDDKVTLMAGLVSDSGARVAGPKLR